MYTYNAQSLVNLPRLTASSTLVLVTALLTAAETQEKAQSSGSPSLPTSISRAKVRMDAACQELSAILAPAPAVDTQLARTADQALDRAWSAMNDFLTAWKKLPAPVNDQVEAVEALHSLLFSEGLSWLQIDYRSEWQQSESRLEAIQTQGHERTLVAIHGMRFLEHIRKSHADYGNVLGITAVKVEESSPAVREKRDATHATMRDYINKVVAWVDPEEAGSDTLAEALLSPLASWETKSASTSKPTTEPVEGPSASGGGEGG